MSQLTFRWIELNRFTGTNNTTVLYGDDIEQVLEDEIFVKVMAEGIYEEFEGRLEAQSIMSELWKYTPDNKTAFASDEVNTYMLVEMELN